MRTQLTVQAAPTVEPVTLADVKSHLRVTHDAEDELITGYVQAAREWVEGYLRRAVTGQTLELYLEQDQDAPFDFPVELRGGTFQELSSVKLVGNDYNETTLDNDWFGVIGRLPSRLVRKSHAGPVSGVSLSITYQVSGDGAPVAAQQAIRLLVAHWYENREATTLANSDLQEPPFSVKTLLQPFRELRI